MPMDFKAAGARVRELIAAKKPAQLQTSALTADPLRDNIVDEAIERSTRFQATAGQTPNVEWKRPQDDGSTVPESFAWDTFPDALRDVARAAFGWEEPEIAGRDRVRPSHRFNRDVLAHIVNHDDFIAQRPYTRENEAEALFGAMSIADKVTEAAAGAAEHIARAKDMAQAEQQIDDAQQMIDQLREQAKADANEIWGVDPDTAGSMKDAIRKREAAREQLGQLVDAHEQSSAPIAAAELAAKAVKGYGEAVQSIGSLPGTQPGEASNLTPDQQIKLAEKWASNPDLRKIAKMVGRLVRDMTSGLQSKTTNVEIEPVGITTGRDIERMLPHELARALIPQLRPLWLKDWAEGSLLVWEMSGKEPKAKGPIMCVLDGTGSMSTNGKQIWASSLTLALFTIAQREHRAFACVEFGASGQFKSWFFAAREPADPDQVLDMATHFFRAAGTSILTGMREAQRIVDEQPEFKTADIVLLSDGQDNYRDEDARIVRELRAKEVRIHGLSILCKDNRYMRQACDYVVDVVDLAGANDASTTVAQNLT